VPWKGVTVSEQRQRFLEDYQQNYYSVTELAERFSISRTTAYKWINRFKRFEAQYARRQRKPPARSVARNSSRGCIIELGKGA